TAARAGFSSKDIALAAPVRSLLQDALPLKTDPLSDAEIGRRYQERLQEERLVPRRHGALLRSGQGMLLDETTLCATVWMHGVFGAQLTIGNTSFHKLFSVSRDPYNVTRASGLRIMLETKEGWR